MWFIIDRWCVIYYAHFGNQILNDIVKEIDGSEPIYKNAYWYPSTLEYEVSFKIPSKDQGEDMIQITLCGLSHRVTNKDDACEVVARDAI